MCNMRITGCLTLVAALALCAAPAVAAIDLAGNGGFEIAGVGGPADSDQWTEFVSSASNLSERTTTNPATGSFAHHLYAEGMDMMGTVAAMTQNSGNDVGLASLQEGTLLNASFDAMLPLGPGGVMNYTLRILNGAGGIVGIYNNTIPTANAAYSTYTTPDLTVPAFGAAPNDYYVAYIEINVGAGGYIGSVGEAYIDNVHVNGTIVPEPASAIFLALGAFALRRRR